MSATLDKSLGGEHGLGTRNHRFSNTAPEISI
jgi:hypothetical protein